MKYNSLQTLSSLVVAALVGVFVLYYNSLPVRRHRLGGSEDMESSNGGGCLNLIDGVVSVSASGRGQVGCQCEKSHDEREERSDWQPGDISSMSKIILSQSLQHTDVLLAVTCKNKGAVRLLTFIKAESSTFISQKPLSKTQPQTLILKQRKALSTPQLQPDNKFLVPNVVHFVWFGCRRSVTFMHYLTFRSVSIHLQPDHIFLHGDCLPPPGKWWNTTLREVPNLYHVYLKKPDTAPNGSPLKYIEHATDIARIRILLAYGGIYLDTDVFVLRSFDRLRQYPMVMGRETEDQINSGIIIAQRGQPFLSLWLEAYWSYAGLNEEWSLKATWVPHILAVAYPHLIHVEERSLHRPNWQQPELTQLYQGHFNWNSNYAIHVWQRNPAVKSMVPNSPGDIDRLDSTLGEISRFILYGSMKLR